MGIFKEEIIFMQDVEKHQKRIWPDSCDVGALTDDIDIERMRDIIKTLLRLPGSALVWKADRPAIQRQYQLIVMWGHSDCGRYDATLCDVLYYKGRSKEYFNVSTCHVFTDENGGIK